MIVYIILAFVIICTYMGFPAWAKIIVFITNIFIPDPIPYADEIIMLIGLFFNNE